METASLTPTPHPSVSRSYLADIEHLAKADPDTVRQDVLWLARARKSLCDARVVCQRAARLYADRPDTRDALAAIATTLRQLHHDFPITILENAQNHRRPKIFSQHEAMVDR